MSIALTYDTFGSDDAAELDIEDIVQTVVIPSVVRAGVASILNQNPSQLNKYFILSNFFSYNGNKIEISKFGDF